MKTYLVGGAVRDRLLGLPVAERDWVVVDATAAELLARGYKQVGKDFPVFLHPHTREEHALARTERKTARGYHGFDVHATPDVSLEDDLRRRDLTINAMALAQDGSLVDPFGGRADLQERWLHHVSTAFSEDPVRILRVARFAARLGPLGFRVHPDTVGLMRDMVAAGEVDALVAERVWKELQRALEDAEPWRFIEVLQECGALARLFPEIDALYGVPQPVAHHPEVDTGVHTLLVLRQAARLSKDPEVRFAALVHDLGKGVTPRDEWPRHVGHERRGVALVQALCERIRTPASYRDLGMLAARYHLLCHRAAELRPSTVLRLLEATDALRRPQRFAWLLLACEADARGRLGREAEPYPQAELLRSARDATLSVDPQALAGQGLRGAAMGEALRRLRVQALATVFRPKAHRAGPGGTVVPPPPLRQN